MSMVLTAIIGLVSLIAKYWWLALLLLLIAWLLIGAKKR